jgi:thioredoxin reductase (NADPH)
MAKPIILAVDDDHAVLNAVERDLRQKYGRDYRVVKADSGRAALEAVRQLCERNERIALFVADQRMPDINGVDFLAQAMKSCPEARKVLLTAYADTEAAIGAINRVGLDYYLMKPWDPQEHLYPILDGLLDDWKSNARAPFEGIRVLGRSGRQRRTRSRTSWPEMRCLIAFSTLSMMPGREGVGGSDTERGDSGAALSDGSSLIQPTQTHSRRRSGLGSGRAALL